MTTRLVLTEVELLAELVKVSEAPDDAMTMVEIADATGWSRGKIRNDVAKLAREGRLLVHRVVRRRLDGQCQVVPAYTVAPKKRGKK